MYGKKQLDSVNDAHLEIFLKKYKPNARGAVISCVKKMDRMGRSSLAPCSRVNREKIKQTNYISSIWNNATIANPPNFQPKNCGWVLENNAFKIKWFKGEMPPSRVKMICPENEDDVSSGTECDNYYDSIALENIAIAL